ncbi:MAG: carboxypeptidase-like regulatory domain-containing protein [Bacteroidales bacterium]|nr:carboxypeptidase-like regulatory domain-containing protein [Bacteroidales bacterium]
MKQAITGIFFLVFLISAAQEQPLKTISGSVLNQVSYLAIDSVVVSSGDGTFTTLTKKSGNFRFTIPTTVDTLYITHPGYQSKMVKLIPNHNNLKLKLHRIHPDASDLPTLKNTVSFLPTKLVVGAFSMRFERFVNLKYSAGAYLTYYYKGREFFGSEQFTGLKTSLYVRRYLKRNKSYGFYAQAAVLVAYFDFGELNYRYADYYIKTVSTHFYTGGLGAAIGMTDIINNTKHLIVDFNVGFQFMPHNYAREITGEHGEKYKHNPLWWYLGGPGSEIELKLAIGGIF